MRRAMVLCLVVGAAALIWGTAGTALAGGGCHDGVTHGTEETVVLADACFNATITTVDPGTIVTFVNKDPSTHNVTANGWGHFDDLDQGDEFRVSFDEAGVYPFACTYHPGMSGAIVVGDGTGPGNGTPYQVGSDDVPPVSAIEPAAAAPASSHAPWVIGAGLIGLGAGAALTAGVTRTRKTPAS